MSMSISPVSTPRRIRLGVIAAALLLGVSTPAWAIMIEKGTPATLDGVCDDYTDGTGHLPIGTDGSFVQMKHDGTYLYICVEQLGAFADRFTAVYLDTNNGKESLAVADDLSLRIKIATGVTSAYQGTGVTNGYKLTTVSGWDAKVGKSTFGDTAEFKIPIALTGALCQYNFGMAVVRHWVAGVGNDVGMPSSMVFDQPKTWDTVTLYGWTMPDADGDKIGDACDAPDAGPAKPDASAKPDTSPAKLDRKAADVAATADHAVKADAAKPQESSGCAIAAVQRAPAGLGLLLLLVAVMALGRPRRS
jgi:hypothetical protein